MVMGFVLVTIGRVFIGVFMAVYILFFLFLLGLFIGWVLVKVGRILKWLLVCSCLFICFFWAVLLIFCGLFFGGGGLPSGEDVWWWSPWFRVFGFWNSFLQLFLLGLVFVSLLLFWIWILRS